MRTTARRLVGFDTLEETLDHAITSFWAELPCDFVAIILKDGEWLYPKAWRGGSDGFEASFPIRLDRCSPNILAEGWDVEKTEDGFQCDFQNIMKQEQITTWFTLPLKDGEESLGFCIIGFYNFVPLITETERIFVEFGKDIATAMKLAHMKEIDTKKMKSIKWFNENIFPGSSLEQLVEKVLELCCRGTRADEAYIYLYDEPQHSFLLQRPYVGEGRKAETIPLAQSDTLARLFPFLEKPGGRELTVLLVVHEKTIGVLHAEKKTNGLFTSEDMELLSFLCHHVAALLENARLYQMESELKQRLQAFMGHQQELVKQTLDGESFDEISRTLSTLFSRSVILFDRFLRPISHHLQEAEELPLSVLLEQIQKRQEQVKRMGKRGEWLEQSDGAEREVGLWPVIGGGDLLGYLAVFMNREELDDVLRVTMEHALNVYAIQFIKQKLVMETKEKVKDSFINQLFQETIKDQEKIIESASLFNWNVFAPHRIAVLTIHMKETARREANLLDKEARKSQAWEQIKERLTAFDSDIVLTRRGEQFLLIVPAAKEVGNAKAFWQSLYNTVGPLGLSDEAVQNVYIGVGGQTEKLTDYFFCFKQALQAHNVVSRHFQEEGFALFEDLGAYTLLNHLKDSSVALLFIETYLQPLIEYMDGKGADLFHTLRMYLYHNGSWKQTMEALFIHRSTLRYRLERIRDILELDIDDAETRLNLMIAYKLYDLYYANEHSIH